MNFCSNCGSDQVSFAIPSGDNIPRFQCGNCSSIFYNNPKMVVGCLPIWEDQILLARRAIDPCKGLWNLPAGYMENGETVEAGAQREVEEETLAQVDLVRVHCIYNLPKVNQVYIHFLANMRSPDFGPTSESLEVSLFHKDNMPWDDLAFSSSRFALKRFFDDPHHQGIHIGTYPHH